MLYEDTHEIFEIIDITLFYIKIENLTPSDIFYVQASYIYQLRSPESIYIAPMVYIGGCRAFFG